MNTFEQFKLADRSLRNKRPKPFLLMPPDRAATKSELDELERALSVHLPKNYLLFLSEYGGGNFGFVKIFSADPESEWYLVERQAQASTYLPGDLIAFSADFAGGYYCFQVRDGFADDRVTYWNCDGGSQDSGLPNIFEFLKKFAYGEC